MTVNIPIKTLANLANNNEYTKPNFTHLVYNIDFEAYSYVYEIPGCHFQSLSFDLIYTQSSCFNNCQQKIFTVSTPDMRNAVCLW